MAIIVTQRKLADTYQIDGDLTPWARVQEYRRVESYCATHQQAGSQAVATALELPRSRIRPWVDGDSKPDPVHAIEDARERGWLDVDVDTDQGRAWARLVAWIYSGGSIANLDYRPTFYVRQKADGALTMSELDVLRDALESIGAGFEIVGRDAGRATQLEPGEAKFLLGRCLAAAGAPVGAKNEQQPTGLPDWLDEASTETKAAFCRVYLLNRGSIRDAEPLFVIREERAESYHEAVVDLFREVVEDPDSISRSGHNVYLYRSAVDELLST